MESQRFFFKFFYSFLCHYDFLISITAYVNGQREGRVLERPFHVGESIARERLTTESSVNSLPELDVEAEMELIGASQENLMAKKMKEMGLDR